MAGQPGRSGGRRQGQRGKQYPNRSDMRKTQAPQAAPNQTYGQAGQQLQAQKVIPLSRASAPVVGSPSPTSQAAPPAGGGGPQVVPSLTAPTSRPNEPLTTGLPTGPGAGPEVLKTPDPLLKAAAVLNSIGGPHPDPMLEKIRAQVNAQLGNQGAA